MHTKFSSVLSEINSVSIGDSHAEHFYPGFAFVWPELNISYFNKPDPPYITSHPFKKIFSYIDKRGTEWKVCWIPLGGYVKFIDDLDPASSKEGTVDNENGFG